MALSQGMIDTYWRRYNQRRALTGFGPSYQEIRGTQDSMLESAANKDLRESELRYRNSIEQQKMKDERRAATVSGIGNVAQLGLEGYLGYKTLTKAPTALETASANYLKSLTPGAAVAPNAATVSGAVAPAAVGAGSGGILSAGVGSGAPLASAAYPGIAGGTVSPAVVGGMSPVVAETAGAGLLGTASAVAGPAGLAAGVGQLLGKPVSKLLGTHEKTTGDVMSIGGGAAVGFAVGGPVGGLIGAALGGLASLF